DARKDGRDLDLEGRAAAELALDGHRAAERLGELLDDAQPEPDATRATRAALAELVEGVEDRIDVCGVDAGARVGHLDRDAARLAARSGGHRDDAVGGELERVVDEIADDLG